jgi:hypothetical protein
MESIKLKINKRPRKAIFSVLLGDYDNVSPAPLYRGWDCILFTDKDVPHSLGWDVVIVPKTNEPDKESRRYKFLSHIYLIEYDIVCYMDANMTLRQAPPDIPTWFKHPKRNNVKDEVVAILELKKADPDMLSHQMDFYKREGFEDNEGLYQNGFFVRSHKNKEVNNLMETVWSTVEAYTYRDQLALPYAMWKHKTKVENIRDNAFINYYIFVHAHKKTKDYSQKPYVHHITPGRSDKNLGKAINDIIKVLPDKDWICIRDIDTIPMYHEMFFKQCESIAIAGEYDLIGCITNRLGLEYQLFEGKKSSETDILKHRGIAKKLYNQYGSGVEKIDNTIAGVFMLFSKKTWITLGRFKEGSIMIDGSFIDYHFSNAALKRGLKIGLAKGIYLFHYYRFDSGDDTKTSIKHLM